MSQDVHIKPAGLFTDPSPHSSVPQGALRRADNIVIRRDGVAEPRPGFEAMTLTSVPDYDPRALFAYDGDVLMAMDNGGLPVTRWLSTPAAAVTQFNTALSYAETPVAITRLFAAEARGNLYLALLEGLSRISGGGRVDTDDASLSASWHLAGLPVGLSIIVNDSGLAGVLVPTSEAIAYRATIESQRGGNPVTVVSAPSGRAVYQNLSGATRNPIITLFFDTTTALAGDIVRFYRSPLTSADTPDDNMQLVKSYTLTSADAAAGYYVFTDTVPTAELGAFLYTSPNQEGAEGSNTIIPGAKDVALFRGSLFFSDLTWPYQQIVTWDTGGTALVGLATGIGRRAVTTCTRTATSAVITMANTVGLAVGQILSTRSSWAGTGVVRIVSIVANTSVTMNTTWGGATDGAPVTLTFKDTININGSYFDATTPSTIMQGVLAGTAIDGVTPLSTIGVTSLGDGQRYKSTGADWNIANAAILISELWPTAVGIVPDLWATHGDEYKPALPTTDPTAVPMKRDLFVNQLAWSKQDQPEHFPVTNVAFVGGATHPILRIVPSRDALWIFKTDGIWRLTGNGSPYWRIDPFDMTTFLIAPKAVAVMDDTVFAWTNHGIVAVSDAGVHRLSGLAVGTDLREAEIVLGAGNVLTPGVFAAANPKDNEVIFGVTDTSTDTTASVLYVFNVKTQAWTKWSKDAYSCGVFNPVNSKLLFAKGDTAAVDSERLTFNRFSTTDYKHSVIGNGLAETGYSLEIVSPNYVPLVGDLLQRSSDSAVTLITGVDDEGGGSYQLTVTTLDFDVGGEGPVFYIYAGYESCIEPVARTGSNASAHKLYQEGSWIFGAFDYIERIALGHTSSLSATAVTEARMFTPAAAVQPRPVRFKVPRAHARTSQYWPRLCIRQAGASWTVEQLSIFYEALSSRVQTR